MKWYFIARGLAISQRSVDEWMVGQMIRRYRLWCLSRASKLSYTGSVFKISQLFQLKLPKELLCIQISIERDECSEGTHMCAEVCQNTCTMHNIYLQHCVSIHFECWDQIWHYFFCFSTIFAITVHWKMENDQKMEFVDNMTIIPKFCDWTWHAILFSFIYQKM